MILSFKDFIEEGKTLPQIDVEGKVICKYRWREPYANIFHTSRCEVLSYNDKTAKIKLIEYGKNGARPGTEMQVHLKSLIGFNMNNIKNNNTKTTSTTDEDDIEYEDDEQNWHKYTYFD